MNKEQKRKSRAICLDNWEIQVVYGALLGNAFIVDPPKGLHCYMVIRQSKKQDVNVFRYKIEELKAFSRKSATYSDANDHRWTSISHQDFDLIRNFCYSEIGKNVTMEWLNTLRDVSLMIWYLDRGFYKNGQMGFNTINLKGAQKVIHQYFNEIGMSCKLDKYKIVFDDKGKEVFMKVVSHRIPTYLTYKFIDNTKIDKGHNEE